MEIKQNIFEELIAASEEIINVFDREEHNGEFAEMSALRRIKEAVFGCNQSKQQETKPAKSFEQCCDEVAKKQGFEDYNAAVFWGLADSREAAELYNQETEAERDRLKEENERLKGVLNFKQDTTPSVRVILASKYDSLEEENEMLKEDREKRIARELNLEEENERLKEQNKNYQEFIQDSKDRVDSLKQLNSKFLREREPWATEHILIKLNEAADILLHKKNYDGLGYEEIEQAVRGAKELLELISKSNQQKEKP